MSLFEELKRRNVFRVGAAYTVTAWLIIQVAETIFPLFGFGDTPARIVVIVLAIGFIPALVLTWVFELTPEGLKRDRDVDHSQPAAQKTGKKLDRMIMLVLALALAYFAFDKFVLDPQRQAALQEQFTEQVAEARQEGRSEALVESFGDHSIAVLPFADLSPEGDQGYLSDGIAEELLSLLARVPELRVTSRTSSFAFRDQSLEIPEIARRLKVGHVLEGSVRKAGSRIRVTAQLIEGRADTHLWSQTWDRELDDVFALQDEIANAVLTSLRAKLLETTDRPAPEHVQTVSPQAYELFLKGRYLLAQRDPGAEGFFSQAIAAEPGYAAAYSGLAKSLYLTAPPEGGTADRQTSTREALQRALELNPEDSDAIALQGVFEADVTRSRSLLERAIALNPNNADAYRWLGLSYLNVDSVRYLEFSRKGYLVDPTSVSMSFHLFLALNRFGRYEEAMNVARDLHRLYPDRATPYVLASTYFYRSGHVDEALRSLYRAYRMQPATADLEIRNIGYLMIELNELELAEEWARARLANDPEGADAHFQYIVALYRKGQRETARQLTVELERQHPDWLGVLSRLHANVSGDFGQARSETERMMKRPDDWRNWDSFRIVDYALALLKTGDDEQAATVLQTVLARVEQQLALGVRSEYEWDLRFYLAVFYALNGEPQKALEELWDDANDGGISCSPCLIDWPHFDGLREIPSFQSLLAESERRNEAIRKMLGEQGLLLPPREVLELGNFNFDPFEE